MSRGPFSLTSVLFFFSIRDLLKFKEEVTKERDQLLTEVVKLRESLAQITEQQQEMERCREEAEQTITQVRFVMEGTMKEHYFLQGCFSLPQSPFPSCSSLKFTPTAQMKHPLFCLFFWFILTRAIFLESLSSAFSF